MYKLISNITEHPAKAVLMMLSGIHTLEGNSITASKTKKEERTFLSEFHTMLQDISFYSILYNDILYGTFSLKFFDSLSTKLLSYSKAAQFQSFIFTFPADRTNLNRHKFESSLTTKESFRRPK